MFVDFVLGWGANFVGIVKGGRVPKSLRTSALIFFKIDGEPYTLKKLHQQGCKIYSEF